MQSCAEHSNTWSTLSGLEQRAAGLLEEQAAEEAAFSCPLAWGTQKSRVPFCLCVPAFVLIQVSHSLCIESLGNVLIHPGELQANGKNNTASCQICAKINRPTGRKSLQTLQSVAMKADIFWHILIKCLAFSSLADVVCMRASQSCKLHMSRWVHWDLPSFPSWAWLAVPSSNQNMEKQMLQ